MIKRLVIAVILLALVGGGLVGFYLFRGKMIAEYFANMPVQPMPVSTVEVKPVTWRPVIDAIGTINAAQGVELTVESAGIVQDLMFEANQQVTAGQLLVRLDDKVQRADLEAARTQLELEQTNLERARQLQSRGVASSVSLDSTEAAARAAEAQVARATAMLEQRQVTAPFGGTIGLPRVEPGQYVTPGTVITTLQNLDTMRVDFSLPEQNLARISIGQQIDVRVEGMLSVFPGQITGIDPKVDASSRLFSIRGGLGNPQRTLVPGQFVRIEIGLPEEDGVLTLPQTGVTTSLYGDYVYAVSPGETEGQLVARQVFVTTGRRMDGMVEVLDGVAPGDMVVSAGQNRLSNGAPVVPDTAAPGEAQPQAQSAVMQ